MRKTNKIFKLLFCFSLMVILCAPNMLQGEVQETLFAVTNVKIFDGNNSISKGSVLVKGRTIAAVGKNIKIPAEAKIINAEGHTLLPGLIDSHTHSYHPNFLKQALVFGVTTELDMFMGYKMVARIKKQSAEGKADDRADLFSAGTLVTSPGGHGTEYGLKIPTITDPANAEQFVLDRIKEGSDYIKIVFDNKSSMPTISKKVLTSVIKAAHKHGKMAIVHSGRMEDGITAIQCGADGLIHLFWDGEENERFGQIAAQHKVFVIPTIPVIESIFNIKGGAELAADPLFEPYLSDSDIKTLSTTFSKKDRQGLYKAVRKAIAQLKSASVPILAGSDAPNPGTAHGVSLHRELERLVDAGLTPGEALASATSVPTKIFSLGKRGRITPGCNADLLLVKGDPLKILKIPVRLSLYGNKEKNWTVPSTLKQ